MSPQARWVLENQLTMADAMDHPFKVGCTHCDQGHVHTQEARILLEENPDWSDKQVYQTWASRVHTRMIRLAGDKCYRDQILEFRKYTEEEPDAADTDDPMAAAFEEMG